MTASAGDIKHLHSRLDKLFEVQGKQALDLGRIATTMEMRPRPCPDHETLRRDVDHHLKEHDQTRSTWQSAFIKGIVDVVKMIAVGAFGWWIGKS